MSNIYLFYIFYIPNIYIVGIYIYIYIYIYIFPPTHNSLSWDSFSHCAGKKLAQVLGLMVSLGFQYKSTCVQSGGLKYCDLLLG